MKLSSVLRRDALSALGIALVAVGLADRMAFFAPLGAVLVPLGFVILGAAAWTRPGGGRVYSPLFAVLCVLAGLAPFDPAGPNPVEAILTIGAGLVFYTLGVTRVPPLARLLVPAALLVAAHGHYLLRFPHPLHQDVWTFLNGGVDMLLRGQNPYRGVQFVEGGVLRTVPYTYPPGALLVLAPFRLLAGDVRWAYVVAEGAVVTLWAVALRRVDGFSPWREALVLLPLALPRTSQGFYIFSNHEWVLLALVMGALVLTWQRRPILAGIVLGLAIASKQYVLVYPALFLLPVFGRREIAIALGVAILGTLPFLLWSPADFLRDTLGNLSQGVQSDRLTLWAALQHLGVTAPRALQAATAGTALVAGLLAGYRGRRDPGRALVVCGVGLAAFAFTSSFAAYNYYAYALVFVTWGLLMPAGLASPPSARAHVAA